MPRLHPPQRTDRPTTAAHGGGPATEQATEAVAILIVHASALIAQALRLALSRWPGVRPVGAASSVETAADLAARRDPDLAMVDSGIEPDGPWRLLHQLRQAAPGCRIVLHTPRADERVLRRGSELGVRAYVRTGASAETIGDALHRALLDDGDPYVDPHLAAQMPAATTGAALSERELQVLQLVADGFSNAETAERLEISEETVKTHVKNIIAKLGARSRTHAATIALRAGLVR